MIGGSSLIAQFNTAADKLMARETLAADSRRKAHISSLTEEISAALDASRLH